MTREQLISQCRYYTGEKESPFKYSEDIRAWFWDWERVYVDHEGVFDGEREYYERLVGKRYSDIPYTLGLVMFTSWGKSVYDFDKSINGFYNLMEDYMSFPNDPKVKVPTHTY